MNYGNDQHDDLLAAIRTADINLRDEDLDVPVTDLRCEFCDTVPRHYYDELYLCTPHFFQLRQKFIEHAKRFEETSDPTPIALNQLMCPEGYVDREEAAYEQAYDDIFPDPWE